jgi:cyclic-di-GMP phosphodiesterase TipF (flagellum assembly factor)
MMRLSAVFIAVCMLVIAGSLGAVLYLRFDFGASDAAIVALAVLTALALYHAVSARIRERADASEQVAELSRATGDLGREVTELGRRVGALEVRVDAAAGTAAALTQPLAAEIGELGILLKELAESVAAHENLFVSNGRPAAPAAEPAAAPAPGIEALHAAVERRVAHAVSERDEAAIDDILRAAVAANRIELYLQPIVTLPQRKVRYYEALSRVKTEDGEVLAAADFIAVADAEGLTPQIDELALFRCVQVVRRLLLKNRDIGLFCNLSAATLAAPGFPQLLEFLDANRAVAPALVFEFTQAAMRAMGPIEHESLAALAARGFRFSMDHVADQRIDPRELADRGVRFVKVPAGVLLGRVDPAASDIHPADLSDLLRRFGIELIAEKVESEGMVVDLLDYELRFGQGLLFSPPRPVRAEILQGIADSADAVARHGAAAAQAASAEATADAPAPAAPARRALAS